MEVTMTEAQLKQSLANAGWRCGNAVWAAKAKRIKRLDQYPVFIVLRSRRFGNASGMVPVVCNRAVQLVCPKMARNSQPKVVVFAGRQGFVQSTDCFDDGTAKHCCDDVNDVVKQKGGVNPTGVFRKHGERSFLGNKQRGC